MLDRIMEILADAAGISVEEITPESEFSKDLGINSLEFADIAFTCEEEFEIEINEKDFRKMIKVSDLIDYINKLK
ncbi:MAG: acyl carrier protein [Clostridiales bacterium]|nr:acyl carrier protein [Clostridiales bacterium]